MAVDLLSSDSDMGGLERNDEGSPLHFDGDAPGTFLVGYCSTSVTPTSVGATSTLAIADISTLLLSLRSDFGGDGGTGVFRLARVTGALCSATSSDAECMGVIGKGVLGPSLVTATAVVRFFAALLLLGGAAVRMGEMGSFDSKALAFSCTLHLAYGENSCLDCVATRLAGERSRARGT